MLSFLTFYKYYITIAENYNIQTAQKYHENLVTLYNAAVGFVQLAQSFGICCAKICATFPLDKSCKVWYNGDFAAHQTCAARHYITKSIFCQVKISKNQKKLVSVFMDTSCQKVSAFTDTNLQKKVSLFMDTFFIILSYLSIPCGKCGHYAHNLRSIFLCCLKQ